MSKFLGLISLATLCLLLVIHTDAPAVQAVAMTVSSRILSHSHELIIKASPVSPV